MKEMFRISLIAEDPKVPKLLRMLRSIGVYDLEAIPVVNAQLKNGKVSAVTPGGTSIERAAAWIKNGEMKTFDTRQLAAAVGTNASNANYTIHQLMDAGVIKRIKKGGSNHPAVFQVMKR